MRVLGGSRRRPLVHAPRRQDRDGILTGMTDLPLLPESTWTAARPDCPDPHLWHSTDDLATEHEVSRLVGAMVTALRPRVVIETGAHIGMTTVQIGLALAEAGRGHAYALEIKPEVAQEARERVIGLPVTVIEGDSTQWEPVDAPVDFMWLDSEPWLRAGEIRRFAHWSTNRTVIGVHDTGPQHVTRGYLDVLVTDGIIQPTVYLPTPRGVCWTMLRPGVGGLS